nr:MULTISPECIES: xylulokinase [Moorella]
MARRFLLGIDVGTSGCKSILVDEEGSVIAKSVAEYPLYTPYPGWAEQEPEDWWRATVATINRLLRESQVNPKGIVGIGLSGQMHGMVPLDAEYRVLRRAILWNDQRTAPQCQEIVQAVGGEDNLLTYTNNAMLPGYTAGKILWLREHEPEVFDKTRIILNPKDYIRFRLTGQFATEVSDASGTGLFDVKNRRWSDKLLAILQISTDLLPHCFESDQVTGWVTRQAAEETGLPAGLPVVGGGGDAVIQTTGMGVTKEGILGLIIGTAGIVAMGLESFKENPQGKLQIFCNNAPGTWHAMGVTLAAGGSYQWYTQTLCEGERIRAEDTGEDVYALLEGSIMSAPPGSKGLVFLPYLSGERCPYADPAARGSFIGLTLLHTKADMTRAVMEGVTYSLYHVFEQLRELDKDMKVTAAIVSGGASRSAAWRQIIADVFQLPTRTVTGSSEGGAYGAALVAGVGCGVWTSIEEAVGFMQIESETEPNGALGDIYGEMLEIYKGLYPALRQTFTRISGVKF